jgi:hypothetical protein
MLEAVASGGIPHQQGHVPLGPKRPPEDYGEPKSGRDHPVSIFAALAARFAVRGHEQKDGRYAEEESPCQT